MCPQCLVAVFRTVDGQRVGVLSNRTPVATDVVVCRIGARADVKLAQEEKFLTPDGVCARLGAVYFGGYEPPVMQPGGFHGSLKRSTTQIGFAPRSAIFDSRHRVPALQ